MRKLVLVLAVTLSSFTNLMAQKDSVTVVDYVDEMTDEKYLFASRDLFVIDEEDTNKGIIITPGINVLNHKVRFIIETFKLGGCNENNILIIKFIDGSKFKMKSYNEFNCKGVTYFSTRNEMIIKLKNIEIDKIYYQNGRTYESGTFPISDKRYFIQLYKGLK